jgi:hypothetical protein
MNSIKPSNDFFSRFVNWFSNSGSDYILADSKVGGKDFFSRLMNRISNM